MTKYCRDNVICLSETCQRLHYKSFEERVVLANLYLKLKEEPCQFKAEHMEPIVASKATCRYHLLCFERECVFNHSGYALDNRKLMIKAFKEHNKREKAKQVIEADMEKKRRGESTSWNQLCA